MTLRDIALYVFAVSLAPFSLAVEALFAIDGVVLTFLSMIISPAPTLTFRRAADLLIGMVTRAFKFLLAIWTDPHAHRSSELTRTAGVAWQINQSTHSFTGAGPRVRLDMKLEIEMRSLILFRFVLEEKKRFVLMEKVKSEVFLTDFCEKNPLI